MKNNRHNKEQIELREEARIKCSKNASVEFKPENSLSAYHFSLKNISPTGFGILVRKDSKVIREIKAGDILKMKYHPDSVTANPKTYKVQIKHISEPGPGKQLDHMLVGLLILENE